MKSQKFKSDRQGRLEKEKGFLKNLISFTYKILTHVRIENNLNNDPPFFTHSVVSASLYTCFI